MSSAPAACCDFLVPLTFPPAGGVEVCSSSVASRPRPSPFMSGRKGSSEGAPRPVKGARRPLRHVGRSRESLRRNAAASIAAGVSRSAHLLPHLTAAASRPLHWPGVACGSYAAASLAFIGRTARPCRPSCGVGPLAGGPHQVHAGLSPGNRSRPKSAGLAMAFLRRARSARRSIALGRRDGGACLARGVAGAVALAIAARARQWCDRAAGPRARPAASRRQAGRRSQARRNPLRAPNRTRVRPRR